MCNVNLVSRVIISTTYLLVARAVPCVDRCSKNSHSFHSTMSVGRLFLLVVVVWCTIHAFHYLTKRKSLHSLPTNVDVARNSTHYSRNTSLTLQAFHLQVSTTRWNALHDQFATILMKQRYHMLTLLLRGLYNIGII